MKFSNVSDKGIVNDVELQGVLRSQAAENWEEM